MERIIPAQALRADQSEWLLVRDRLDSMTSVNGSVRKAPFERTDNHHVPLDDVA